ncbi:SRPBCC family protein [Nocardioides sp. Kera G14]|uniref:SRPBCC family protein n=1 Tax=Nocardioides sp. Kera G14 TaxID=2884264 RepID=UPI001D1225D5|nr:SRPBCC family protein [Nocardioides sp. Kera G14]UDY24020.1 SRPBCC family protein [Nocardioides sp. Kera G14]
MQTISLSKVIPAPIDIVFDEYTDHERLSELPMAISSKVTTPGHTEKNGLGAVRRLNAGAIQLREEITAFERPHLMEYRITWSFPKARHDLGRVEFTEVPGGTRVDWRTVFTVELPLVGGLADPAFKVLFSGVFKTVLHQVEKRSVARAQRES